MCSLKVTKYLFRASSDVNNLLGGKYYIFKARGDFYSINRCLLSRSLHTHSRNYMWEKDIKGEYAKESSGQSPVKMVRDGLKELKHEIKLWKEEVKEKLISDPILLYREGETDVVWKFDSEESLSKWTTTSDKDHNEGYSSCSLSITPNQKGLFSGMLCTRTPKDGRVKIAGYCNMRSFRVRKSFKRDSYFEWEPYTHLVLRVRGDGRSYLLNLTTVGYYDIMWNDMYHYILYTRGGPYWQISKIPFSKFFLASKGRVQDKQNPVPKNRISHVGISVGDAINGPFHLEIDYIGLEFDPNHTEDFAYEFYHTGPYVAGY